MTSCRDDVILWRHDQFFWFWKILLTLARYFGRNVLDLEKSATYVKENCISFYKQNSYIIINTFVFVFWRTCGILHKNPKNRIFPITSSKTVE